MRTAEGLPPLPGAWPAAGTRRRTPRPFVPGRAPPAPRRLRVHALPQPARARSRAAEVGRPARRCPAPRRRPHLRRLPGPATGRGARRAGQSYSPGKRGRPGRAPAPGAAAQRRLREPRPAEGAGSQAASAARGTAAAAAADFLARSKLWPRLHFSTAPAAFPGASAGAEPPKPTRTRANRRPHGAGRRRAREQPRVSPGSGGGPGRAVAPGLE